MISLELKRDRWLLEMAQNVRRRFCNHSMHTNLLYRLGCTKDKNSKQHKCHVIQVIFTGDFDMLSAPEIVPKLPNLKYSWLGLVLNALCGGEVVDSSLDTLLDSWRGKRRN